MPYQRSKRNGFSDYGTYERKARDKKRHNAEYEKQLFGTRKRNAKKKDNSFLGGLFSW